MDVSNSKFAAVPQELRERKQWINWKWEGRNTADEKKRPCDPHGTPISYTDSSKWLTFAQACKACKKNIGLGFTLSADDPFTGVDLDNGLNEDGSLKDWAEEVINELAGSIYCEVSPSGKGLKLITKARYNGNQDILELGEHTGIQAWDKKRFFAITGEVFYDQKTIGEAQEKLDLIAAKFGAINRMLKLPKDDQNDGSKRLYRSAIICAELGLDDDPATEAIGFYLTRNPTPREWEDYEILKRIQDARKKLGTLPTVGVKYLEPRKIASGKRELRRSVIEGFLREREIATFNFGSKGGKTQLMMGLAIAIATGTDWLGLKVSHGQVLVLDNELNQDTFDNRLYETTKALGLSWEDTKDNVQPINFRDEEAGLLSIDQLIYRLNPKHTYQLVILDALYRVLPEGVNENSNPDMTRVFNILDRLAKHLNCAIVVVHHSSKGDQSGKAVTDVGAGAGAISRASDNHIVLREHEKPKHFVLECRARSFPELAPMTLKFDFPLWTVVDVEPKIKQAQTRRDQRQQAQDDEADFSLKESLEAGPLSQSQIERATGMGPTRVKRAIGRVTKAGLITSIEESGIDKYKLIATVPR